MARKDQEIVRKDMEIASMNQEIAQQRGRVQQLQEVREGLYSQLSICLMNHASTFLVVGMGEFRSGDYDSTFLYIH